MDGAGTLHPDAPRGVVLNARIIWAFAAAAAQTGTPAYLEASRYAAGWFLEHFIDPEQGGVYWSVSAKGEALEDKKQLYSQGFAIYGLSELARANGDKEALNEAVNLFKVVEAKPWPGISPRWQTVPSAPMTSTLTRR